jgi:hypothetical protein
MSTAIIRQLLETQLASALSGFAIAWENARYTPTVGTPFASVFLLPAATRNPAIAADGVSGEMQEHNGVLQVVLNYPLSDGTQAFGAKADAVVAAFPVGLTLTQSAITVRVLRTPAIAPAFPKGAWYVVPVSIPYYAHVFV